MIGTRRRQGGARRTCSRRRSPTGRREERVGSPPIGNGSSFDVTDEPDRGRSCRRSARCATRTRRSRPARRSSATRRARCSSSAGSTRRAARELVAAFNAGDTRGAASPCRRRRRRAWQALFGPARSRAVAGERELALDDPGGRARSSTSSATPIAVTAPAGAGAEGRPGRPDRLRARVGDRRGGRAGQRRLRGPHRDGRLAAARGRRLPAVPRVSRPGEGRRAGGRSRSSRSRAALDGSTAVSKVVTIVRRRKHATSLIGGVSRGRGHQTGSLQCPTTCA